MAARRGHDFDRSPKAGDIGRANAVLLVSLDSKHPEAKTKDRPWMAGLLQLPARPAVLAAASADKLYTPPGGELVDSVLSRIAMLFSSKETNLAGVAAATQVADTVLKGGIVVVGMSMNPECSKAVNALDAAGHGHTYLEYGGYASLYSERLAIKRWSGWKLFPQVFVKGQLVGGLGLTRQLIASGELATLLK